MSADLPVWDPAAARPVPPADRSAHEDTLHCNRCGFCTSFCPTYLATGEEALSPRGRNQAFRALLEGRLPPEDGRRAFETCLQCGVCTSVCFAQVPTGKLMSAAREKSHPGGRPPVWIRLLVRVLLPRPALFERGLKAAYGFKRWGVARWLNRAGVLARLSPALAAAESLVDEVPRRFLREELPIAPADAAVVRFVACGPNVILPSVGRATTRLLERAGVASVAAPSVCCGLPGISAGDREGARALARRNIEILERYPRALVLVDDSSCAAALKDYPEWLADDPLWGPRARALRARVRDLLEWLAENAAALPSAQGTVVTYHDACKARYGQGLVEEPRRALRAVGAELRELPEAEQCCGGGGTYAFTQPGLSRAVGDRKAERVASTGAPTALTSSVSCLLQLRDRLRRAGRRARAFHLAEFLAEGLDERPELK